MSVNEHTGAALRTPPATEKFRNGWDNIDWGKKPDKPTTCMKCPRDASVACGYCGLRQSTGEYVGLVELIRST